jgi:hypothetical protein
MVVACELMTLMQVPHELARASALHLKSQANSLAIAFDMAFRMQVVTMVLGKVLVRRVVPD